MLNKRYRIEPMPDRQYAENITFKEFALKLGNFALNSVTSIKNTLNDKISQFGYAIGVDEPTHNQSLTTFDKDDAK